MRLSPAILPADSSGAAAPSTTRVSWSRFWKRPSASPISGYQPQRTIMFAFGEDEEVGGGKGNAAIAKALQSRGTHFAWVLDEGSSVLAEPYPGVQRPVALIATAEKGYLTLELTAHGQGGHAARPSGDLALARLSSAILNVVGHPFDSDLDDIQRQKLSVLAPFAPFGQRLVLTNLWLTRPLVIRAMAANPETAAALHTTISPTMMSAGVKDNVIPPTAQAVINFRLHPRDSIRAVIDHVRDADSRFQSRCWRARGDDRRSQQSRGYEQSRLCRNRERGDRNLRRSCRTGNHDRGDGFAALPADCRCGVAFPAVSHGAVRYRAGARYK